MMSDKYISHFSDLYRPKIDGISVSLELLHNEFQDRNIRHDLYVPKTPGIYRDDENIRRFSSIPVLFQPEVRFTVPLDMANLSRAYREKYDIVHSHTPGPMGLLAWQVAKIHNLPHIHTYHTFFPDYSHYVFDGKVLSQHTIEELSRWWAQRCDVVIAPSVKIYDWLHSIGVTRTVVTVPSGIDTKVFSHDYTNSRYLVEKGYVLEDDFVLLFVGRVAKEKALDTLFNYISHMSVDYLSRMKLVVVGGGPGLGRFTTHAQQKGLYDKVVFTNYIPVSDVRHAYSSADAFAFLSTSETQGLVVAEALSASLPVLVSSDAAYSGMIEEGSNGYICDDEESFIKGLTSLMEDPEKLKAFSMRSREISTLFDISRTTDQLLCVYQDAEDEYRKDKGPPRFVSSVMGQYRRSLHDSIVELRERFKSYVQS